MHRLPLLVTMACIGALGVGRWAVRVGAVSSVGSMSTDGTGRHYNDNHFDNLIEVC